MGRSSRTSNRDELIVRHHSSDSPRIDLEDSTGILAKSKIHESNAFYGRNSGSFYDRGCMQTPGDETMLFGGLNISRPAGGPLGRIRFGDDD